MPKINKRLKEFLSQTFWVNSSHFGTVSVKIEDIHQNGNNPLSVFVVHAGFGWWVYGWELFDTKKEALSARGKSDESNK